MRNIWRLESVILVFFILAGCAHRATTEKTMVAPLISVLPGESELYEVIVKQVLMDQGSSGTAIPVIVLTNKGNDNQILPIWVGVSEGMSINMALNKQIPPRPGTHDLFTSVLGQFQMKLVKVVITDLYERTYIAMMTMESRGETREIDARPSDAIALALRTAAPIFVSEKVISKSGWLEVPQQDEKKKEIKKKHYADKNIDDSI